jgi:Major capsid protein N-terminus/Large eukaryotic DNA virus major capsid protein
MPGGLLNLVSEGQTNIILNSNPSKTFWKAAYKKYTNFGLQKFRLDYEGTPTLNLTTESTFVFKVKRYADLLMDCYISINLPNIWSPIFPPEKINRSDLSGCNNFTDWAPYEFKWIENIGAQIISRITITCGNQKLQEYSGQYILASVQRDFGGRKLELFNEMIGNVPELNDPGNYGARVNAYPNAYYTANPAGAQPSIPGRTLYIPLGAWFNLVTTQAFPLVSLQYNELQINVSFRPINEWFTIRDVMDHVNNYPTIAPNFNQYYMQFYRFLHTPPDLTLGPESYMDTRTIWNADINLNCTYCFLSNDESKLFAKNEQKYLFKQIYEKPYYNITGQNKIDIDSIGMVISWMFYFQRSDVNLRNQWSNYTNWPYNYMPQDVSPAPTNGDYPNPLPHDCMACVSLPTIGPGVNPDGTLSGLYLTGVYNPQNIKHILVALGILLDGQYRENIMPAGVYNFIEKYVRTTGNAPSGLYCYNFCLETSPRVVQPSGAMNMSRFTNVQFEFTTISPPVDPYAQVLTICDPATGDLIGINKPTWRIYDYNFNLYVIEERVNCVIFTSGNAGLLYAT